MAALSFSVDDHPVLKADAIKYLIVFRNMVSHYTVMELFLCSCESSLDWTLVSGTLSFHQRAKKLLKKCILLTVSEIIMDQQKMMLRDTWTYLQIDKNGRLVKNM